MKFCAISVMERKILPGCTRQKPSEQPSTNVPARGARMGASFSPPVGSPDPPMNTQLDLAQLFNVLGDAVIVADTNGNIVGWNAPASRIFGFSQAQALGSSLTLIIPERLRHRHNVGFDKSMETGTTRYGSQLFN